MVENLRLVARMRKAKLIYHFTKNEEYVMCEDLAIPYLNIFHLLVDTKIYILMGSFCIMETWD